MMVLLNIYMVMFVLYVEFVRGEQIFDHHTGSGITYLPKWRHHFHSQVQLLTQNQTIDKQSVLFLFWNNLKPFKTNNSNNVCFVWIILRYKTCLYLFGKHIYSTNHTQNIFSFSFFSQDVWAREWPGIVSV